MKWTTCIITQIDRKLEHAALVALLLLPGRHPPRGAGRAIVLRIEPPAVSHPIRASTVSSLHSTDASGLAAPGQRAALALKVKAGAA